MVASLIASVLFSLPTALVAQERNTDRIKVEASKVLPNPELHIRRVTVQPGTENVTIAFEARANVNAIVEVSGATIPKKSARVSGDPPRGKYQVTIAGLKSATRYNYAIVVPSNDPRTPYRLTGNFTTERPAAVAAQRAPLTETAAYHIRNVKVVPDAEKVVFSFTSRPDIVPIVQVGRRAPRRNSDVPERWEFSSTDLVGAYPVGGDKARGTYSVDISKISELQQATTYHYIINVPSSDTRRPWQETGNFSTKLRVVTLNFKSIQIVNDSDPSSAGDLQFRVYVNGQHRFTLGSYDKPLKLESGARYDINREVVIENAPEKLVIHVEGLDDDDDAANVLVEAATLGVVSRAFVAAASDEPTFMAPGKSNSEEWNVARRELNLTQEPKFYRHVIPAMPLGRSGSQLSFSIAVEVDNPLGR